jgi:hypothetical protein
MLRNEKEEVNGRAKPNKTRCVRHPIGPCPEFISLDFRSIFSLQIARRRYIYRALDTMAVVPLWFKRYCMNKFQPARVS